MNTYFALAGVIALAVAAAHSFLGERWVFSRMRLNGYVPTNGGTVLREPHVRILWASWHILSVFGLAPASCLFFLATASLAVRTIHFVGGVVSISMLFGSALVFVGTRARHLGWLGLLMVSVFTFLGVIK